jgi:hypothetical protein
MGVALEDLRAQALGAHRWEVRNIAVKELGKRKGEEGAKETLLDVVSDRRPSVWWRRLMGEPFFQVGFSRRNAWASLAEHTPSLEEIEASLDQGLDDPYYEVRTAIWKLLAVVLKDKDVNVPVSLKENLRQRMNSEGDFEILTAALGVSDRIYEMDELLAWSSKLDAFKHWRVRAAYLDAIERCCDRGILRREEVEPVLKNFNLRSEYFQPVFMLKEHGSRLERSLRHED